MITHGRITPMQNRFRPVEKLSDRRVNGGDIFAAFHLLFQRHLAALAALSNTDRLFWCQAQTVHFGTPALGRVA